ALLFKNAGQERVEMVAKTAGNRKRIAAAFETSEDKLYEEYFKRLANPQALVEVPSADAPVHAIKITGKDVDLTMLPFHPQHAFDGSCYLSSAIDYTVDPATGRRIHGLLRRDSHGSGLSLYRDRHAHRCAAPHAVARFRLRTRSNRQRQHHGDTHGSGSHADSQKLRARAARRLFAGDLRRRQ